MLARSRRAARRQSPGIGAQQDLRASVAPDFLQDLLREGLSCGSAYLGPDPRGPQVAQTGPSPLLWRTQSCPPPQHHRQGGLTGGVLGLEATVHSHAEVTPSTPPWGDVPCPGALGGGGL